MKSGTGEGPRSKSRRRIKIKKMSKSRRKIKRRTKRRHESRPTLSLAPALDPLPNLTLHLALSLD